MLFMMVLYMEEKNYYLQVRVKEIVQVEIIVVEIIQVEIIVVERIQREIIQVKKKVVTVNNNYSSQT